MRFFQTLFSKIGLGIAVYVLIGVFANTAAPHVPSLSNFNVHTLHSVIQYGISILTWPLSLWHPTFTVGKWVGH